MVGCKPFMVDAKAVKEFTTKQHEVILKHLDDDKAKFLVDNEEATLPRVSGEYPLYREILPKEAPKLTVKINARYLFELLQVMEKMSSEVTISLYGEHDAIKLETLGQGGQTAMALLMPIHQ